MIRTIDSDDGSALELPIHGAALELHDILII